MSSSPLNLAHVPRFILVREYADAHRTVDLLRLCRQAPEIALQEVDVFLVFAVVV